MQDGVEEEYISPLHRRPAETVIDRLARELDARAMDTYERYARMVREAAAFRRTRLTYQTPEQPYYITVPNEIPGRFVFHLEPRADTGTERDPAGNVETPANEGP